MSNNIKIEDIDFEFLPLIYDIIRSIEKELNESNVGQKSVHREQTEIPTKIQALNDKFKKCREQLMKIEGIEVTKEQQLKQLETLSKQLEMKRQLLSKYKQSRIDLGFNPPSNQQLLQPFCSGNKVN